MPGKGQNKNKKRQPRKPPPNKFPGVSQDEVLEQVAMMDRRGWSQRQIAAVIRVSPVMVSKYRKKIREMYAESIIEERAVLVSEKVAQLKEIRKEAWDAWERSKEDTRKETVERVPPPKLKEVPGEKKMKGVQNNLRRDAADFDESMKKIKEVVTREGRLPDSVYLKLVLSTLESEAKLLGILDEKYTPKVELNFWEGILEESQPVDLMQEELEKRRLLPPNAVIQDVKVSEPVENDHSDDHHEHNGLAGIDFTDEDIIDSND